MMFQIIKSNRIQERTSWHSYNWKQRYANEFTFLRPKRINENYNFGFINVSGDKNFNLSVTVGCIVKCKKKNITPLHMNVRLTKNVNKNVFRYKRNGNDYLELVKHFATVCYIESVLITLKKFVVFFVRTCFNELNKSLSSKFWCQVFNLHLLHCRINLNL